MSGSGVLPREGTVTTLLPAYSLFKRGDIWYLRWSEGGARHARSTGTSSKRQADAIAQELLARNPRAESTLGEWAAPFFSEDCPHCSRLAVEGRPVSPRYLRTAAGHLRRHVLSDPIVSITLAELSRTDVLDFRDRLVRKLGPCRTVNAVLRALGVVVHEAMFRDIISKDPMARISAVRYQPEERMALDLASLQSFLREDRFPDRIHFLATATAGLTGLRAGEVRGLQWADLDPEAGLVRVRRSVSGDRGEVGPPKWGKTRSTAYPAALQALLEPLRGAPAGWVFERDGAPMGYTRWAKAVRQAAKGAGLVVTIHVLRHTLHTLLRDQGIPDDKLRGSFGWSGPAIQERYTHRELYDLTPQAMAVDAMVKKEKPCRKKKT